MPQLMGIINLTPDSFWEPSRYPSARTAFDSILQMKADGASIADIGAVSSRPGAEEISEEQEWQRLEPLLEILGQHLQELPAISIDTTRSRIVCKVAGILNQFIVNDISAGDNDPEMLDTVARFGLGYVAMHHRGTPRTMDALTEYENGVVEEVKAFFTEFAVKAQRAGIHNWILDPGFGFAKTGVQNMELLEHLEELKTFGVPVLAGVSNKRFTRGREDEINRILSRKNVDIIRVHDVAAARKIFCL